MKRNGFTLIELLATIVVIAVVSLITVPVVVSVIEKSRKASFIRSAENIKKISKKYYVDNSLEYQDIDSIYFDCNNSECISNSSNIKKKNLGATGSMGDGYVKIYDKGEIEFLLTNGKYCAEKNPNKEEVKIYNGNCEGIIIDNEKIRINSIKTTSTTSTIKVFGDVITGKSGVSKYEFYIDNKLDATVKTNDTNYTHTFDKLTTKNHKIKIKVYNGTYGKPNYDESLGMDEKEIDASLADFGEIKITSSSTEWKTSKTYTIISNPPTGTKVQYKVVSGTTVKQDWTDYGNAIKVDWTSTTKVPTYIYARFNDGVNVKNGTPYVETKIDTTEPVLTIGNITTTTKSINIPIIKNEDLESGIKSTSCEYGTNAGYGSIGTMNGNNCIISNINPNTTYYYKVVTTNNAGLSTEKTGNSKTGETSITFNPITQYPANTTYAQSKTVTVNYTVTDVTNPTYYVRTTVSTTSTVDGYYCGTKTDPENCTSTATKSYAANTWYRVTENPTITLKANGTIYGRINDGAIYSSSNNYTETKIDVTAPTVTLTKGTVTTNSITIVASATDNESGISGYEFSIDNGATWKAKQTSNTYIFNGLSSGTYNIKSRVHNNVGLSTISATLSVSTTSINLPTINIPGGWATSKSVTITYPNVSIKQYSLDGGNTWNNYTGAITFTTNGSIIARASDGTNTVRRTGNVSGIDTILPTVSYSVVGGTYNSYKTVRVLPSDANYSRMAVHVYKNSALIYSGKVDQKSTDSTSASYFDVALDSDGAWTIYTQVFDQAGNKQNQNPNNGDWYYQTYIIETKETCLTGGSKKTGDAVTCWGYDWYVMWNDGEKVAYLMKDKLPKMAHGELGGADAGWNNSKINKYLNTTFLNQLITNGLDSSKLYATPICLSTNYDESYYHRYSYSEPGGGTLYSYNKFTFAGYTKEKLNYLKCMNQKVHLI